MPQNVPAVVATLRQWAIDAQTFTNATNWVGTGYTAQKDATIKTTIQRLGTLSSHLADLLALWAGQDL